MTAFKEQPESLLSLDFDKILESQLNELKKDLIKANLNRNWVPWIVVMEPEKIEFECRRVLACAEKLDNFQYR